MRQTILTLLLAGVICAIITVPATAEEITGLDHLSYILKHTVAFADSIEFTPGSLDTVRFGGFVHSYMTAYTVDGNCLFATCFDDSTLSPRYPRFGSWRVTDGPRAGEFIYPCDLQTPLPAGTTMNIDDPVSQWIIEGVTSGTIYIKGRVWVR